jgi:predicted Rossmann fold nucleotide-binding protein DprA/Smf involved in DNA uptake
MDKKSAHTRNQTKYYLENKSEILAKLRAKREAKKKPRGNLVLLADVYQSIKEKPGHYCDIAKRFGLPPARMYTIMPSMEEAGYLLAEDPKYGILSVYELDCNM